MTKIIEAIYSNGRFEPVGRVDLADQERVTLTVQTHERPDSASRAAAFERLLAGIAGMNFRSTGAYPSRGELYERP